MTQELNLTDSLAELLESGSASPTQIKQVKSLLKGTVPGLFALVRHLVATNDITGLQKMSDGDTILHDALDRGAGSFNQAPFLGAPEKPVVSAIRAVAALGLVLVDKPENAITHLAVFRTWRELSGLAAATEPVHRLPRNASGPHIDVVRELVVSGQLDVMVLCQLLALDGWFRALEDSGARLAISRKSRLWRWFAARLRRWFDDRRLPGRRGPSVRVLFDRGRVGQQAILELWWLPNFPKGLFAHPSTMPLGAADAQFASALAAAWTASRGARHGALVWSLTTADGPVNYVVGPSLGLAFTVLIAEHRRLTRRFVGWLTIRRLNSIFSITGALDSANLTRTAGVSGYEAKIAAMSDDAVLIFPEIDMEEVKRAEAKVIRNIVRRPAATWRQAARASRRARPVRLVVIALTFAVGILGIGVPVFITTSREATASKLAATALSNLNTRLDTARLLAVAAYRMSPSLQTRSALFQVAAASPHLVRFMPIDFEVSAMEATRDGAKLVFGTASGDLVLRDVNGAESKKVHVSGSAITAVTSDQTGALVAAADATHVYLWHTDKGTAPVSAELKVAGPGHPLSISPSGQTVAALAADSESTRQLRVIDKESAQVVRSAEMPGGRYGILPSFVGRSDDRTITVGSDTGTWATYTTSDLKPEGQGGELLTPASYLCCGYSANGDYVVWSKYGDVTVTPANPASGKTAMASIHLDGVDTPSHHAVSADGAEVAIAEGEDLWVSDIGKEINGIPVQTTPIKLGGVGRVSALAFVGDGHRHLAAVSGSSVALFDIEQVSPLVTNAPRIAPSSPTAGIPPKVDISSDGRRVVAFGSDELVVTNTPGWPDGQKLTPLPGATSQPLWDATGSAINFLGHNGAANTDAVRISADPQSIDTWPAANGNENDRSGTVLAARLTADRSKIVQVDDHGRICVRDAKSGAVLTCHPGLDNVLAPPFAQQLGRAAVSADASLAAIVLPEGNVRVTEIGSGTNHVIEPDSPATAVTFGAAELFVQWQDGQLDRWTTDDYELAGRMPGTASYTQAVAAIPETDLVARLTEQGNIELWSTESSTRLGFFTIPTPADNISATPWAATSLMGAPTGKSVISAGGGGLIIPWGVDPEHWIREACKSAGRNLTPEEWKRHTTAEPPEDLTCK